LFSDLSMLIVKSVIRISSLIVVRIHDKIPRR
jgi:hypothetical protein